MQALKLLGTKSRCFYVLTLCTRAISNRDNLLLLLSYSIQSNYRHLI